MAKGFTTLIVIFVISLTDLMMKAEVFGSKYKSFVILDPMTVPMESIYSQLQNTRVFTTAMLAAPMAKSQKSQRVVEASRKSQNLNCFGMN